MQQFACAGAAGVRTTPLGVVGSRCRSQRQVFGERCKQHLDQANPETLLKPHLILHKIRINKNWRQRFLDAGIHAGLKTQQRVEELQVKHAEEAKREGRNFHTYRQGKGDSGTAVFGNAVAGVDLVNLLGELIGGGYVPTDLHIEDLENDEMSVFILAFRNDTTAGTTVFTDQVIGELQGMFSEASWNHVHIYANPPKEDGTITHTVNCAHRQPQTPAKFKLSLAGGLWNLLPVPVAAQI